MALHKKTIFWLLRLGLGLIIIYMVFGRQEVLNGVWEELQNVNILPVLGFLGIMFINTMLSSYKWQTLLEADGIHVPYRVLLSTYLSGTFFNMFLPSSIGGDVYRIAHIGRYSSKRTNSAASVFADRLSGLFVVITFGLIFSVIGVNVNPELANNALIKEHPYLLIMVPAGFGCLLFLIWALFQQKLMRWGLKLFRLDRIGLISKVMDQFLDSFSAYKDRRSTIVKITLISLAFQFNMILCVYFLSLALGIAIPFLYFAMFTPIMILVEALPISVGGVGPREALFEALATQFG